MSTIHVPYIIERSPRGERTYDIFSRLLMDRIVFLGTEVNDDVANILIAQLLFLEADAPGKEIQIYINSPGGSVPSGLAIYDTMQHISVAGRDDLRRHGGEHGLLSSGGGRQGAPIGAAACANHDASAVGRRAPKDRRRDIEIVAREILYNRAKLYELLGKHTASRSSGSSASSSAIAGSQQRRHSTTGSSTTSWRTLVR